jgi:cytochrome c oxidase assembly protein subunit 15
LSAPAASHSPRTAAVHDGSGSFPSPVAPRRANRALNAFAWANAAATLILIGFGGLVTSHGAGLSVPDWPNTYGYNLFFFPIARWVGGIFYEHTHRLFAAAVGLLTTLLALWLWRAEPRRWIRCLGGLAWVGVVLQGVLGGLRVTLLSDQLGIVHGTLAQLCLALAAALALFTSPAWIERPATPPPSARLRGALALACAAILAQLILGAAMRHQHAGLAIPDFPLAYGRLWPATDAAAIRTYNQTRIEIHASNPIRAFDIRLQMFHRLGALGVLASVLGCHILARRESPVHQPFARGTVAAIALVLIQIGLGAATIWTDKSADLATAHVVTGAALLVLSALLLGWAHRAVWTRTRP